jgi:hypothetical protein
MQAENGEQRQNTYIDYQARQHAAALVRKAGQRRMNPWRVMQVGTNGPKRTHQTPSRFGLTLS